MASKKTESKDVQEEITPEVSSEEEKLDIEDILDPEESETPIVDEKGATEAVVEDAPVAERPKKEKKNLLGGFKKKEKTKKEKSPVKEDDFFKPVSKDEPLLVTKKRSIWGTIVTVLLTMILTAAAVLGGVYYYTKYQNSKVENPEQKIEENVSAETEGKKFVYVDSEIGLFLRKEPNVLSEKLSIIPNGTKLEVLEESGAWYRVEYGGKEGWIAKEFTTEKNPQLYENLVYGFKVPVPIDWVGYKVFELSSNEGVKEFIFAVPTSDKNWSDIEGVTKGFASKFVLIVYTPAQFSATQAQEGPKPGKVAENSKYIFAVVTANAGPQDQSGLGQLNYKDITAI